MKLYGNNPVIERLKADPKSVRKIYIQDDHKDRRYLLKKAAQWGIPIVAVPRSKIQKLARNTNTQGLLAEIDSFVYTPYHELLTTALKKNISLVFLDQLNDPQNLGAILRTLACLGKFAVVLPLRHSVEVTETVLRIACGGENHISVSQVANLKNAVSEARDAGFWVAGAVVEGGEPLHETQFSFPMGLVLGSEQKGIRAVVRQDVDALVTFPMVQPRMSMNVAHAATLFCYEMNRQRNQKKG